MKHLYLALAATLLSYGLAAVPASGQPAPPAPTDVTPSYSDLACGTWVNDEWVPNGKCPPETTRLRHDSVSGTITKVEGHLVSVQQTNRTLVINDQPALDRKATGKVGVGRQVVAYGYWLDGTFYATAIY
ncbi:MAG: hypothetical protein JOZ59_02525 [Candidatus Eremiobacteraeota bacterium]|nr:hypothetical protein [Candidatus Eremiobacteraeota bacterium]